MPMKSFRALIASGEVQTISLHTNNGSTGYRIKKFQLMPYAFGASTGELESIVKIYSTPQDSTDGLIDFSDNELLGAAIINAEAVADSYPTILTTVFDLMTFNQDIYVTHENLHADAGPVSYYIELEQIKLDLNRNTVATLKDIRNRKA
jgi:hypothetical protein